MIPHVDGSKAGFEDDELSFAAEKAKNIKWYDRILLNRPLKIIIALVIVAIVAPLLMYRYIFFPSLDLPPSDGFSFGSCLVPRESRLPCGKEAVTSEQCHAQCCYDFNSNVCFHRYPSRFSYLFNGKWSEEVLLNPRTPTVPYASQRSLTNIRLSVDEVSATHVSLTFYDSKDEITGQRIEEKNYEYNVSAPELNVVVSGTQGNIFNTARGPLIASNNIWEISFTLTNESMYGLGEIPLKGDTVKMIYSHKGGLNSIPLIFAKSNGSYHGLLIETKAPTEIVVRSDNQLVVRSITDWGLKFHLFVGPKPADVMKDVMGALGVKKSLEYWMLGTHICSEATAPDSLAELQTFITTATTQRFPFESHCGAAPVVFNTQCNTTHVNLVNQGAAQIRNARKKFVPHVSPYINYTALPIPEVEDDDDDETEIETRSTDQRCFDDENFEKYNIRDSESKDLYKGSVDEHTVIYPSYEDVSEEFMQSLWVYNTNFDGVVLENNWPLDESEKDIQEVNRYLPYFNENFEAAFNFTPQWNATRPVFNHTQELNATQLRVEKYLYTHNEYGNHFATAFEKIKGPVPTLTTSQWMNVNVIINRQNIPTSWTSLQKELIEASLGAISGNWYWSSPVCGDTEHFNNVTQIRLCAKWYMAATYMPMIKVHSKEIRRDPLAFVGTDRTHMITAITRRMSLLPYFHSVLQEGPLLRPMFYQYPSSENLTDLTNQFAVGDDLLIVPNLQPSQTHVHLWMPPGTWYEFWSGLKIHGNEGEVLTMSTTEADFLTLLRGGSIIVMQKNVQLTTDLTRLQSAYSLIVALQCETTNVTESNDQTSTTENTIEEEIASATLGSYGEERIGSATTEQTSEDEEIKTTTEAPVQTVTTCNAYGKFYMTENITIKFEASGKSLKITALGEDFQVFCSMSAAIWSRTINEISIFGLDTDKNNYDDKRIVRTTIDLCQLQTNDEIVFEFVN